MATIFNSRTARTVLAESNDIPDAPPPMDPSVLSADRLYGPADEQFRTTPHLTDGRSLSSLVEAIAAMPGQNADVLKRMLDIIELSGPAAQAEKRKAEQVRHDQRNAKRTASRIVFKASQYNEDGSVNWNNVSDPDDNYAEADAADALDTTNFNEDTLSSWENKLRGLGIQNPGKLITETPDISILLPNDPNSKNRLKSRIVDDAPAKKPCNHADCSHNMSDLMAELKWVDPGMLSQKRCDKNEMVCSSCENLPMAKGKSCSTCGRNGTLSADQIKSEPQTYDPDAIKIDSGIIDTVAQGISNPGVVVDKRPDNYEKVIEGKPGEFDTNPDEVNFGDFVTELAKNHQPIVEPGEEGKEEEQPEEEEVTSEELQGEEQPGPEDVFEQQPITVQTRADHSKKCSYGCVNGSIIGSSNSKARQQIKTMNNSPERLAAIQLAQKQVSQLKNQRSRPGYLKRLVNEINQQFYRCPDLADEG